MAKKCEKPALHYAWLVYGHKKPGVVGGFGGYKLIDALDYEPSEEYVAGLPAAIEWADGFEILKVPYCR